MPFKQVIIWFSSQRHDIVSTDITSTQNGIFLINWEWSTYYTSAHARKCVSKRKRTRSTISSLGFNKTAIYTWVCQSDRLLGSGTVIANGTEGTEPMRPWGVNGREEDDGEMWQRIIIQVCVIILITLNIFHVVIFAFICHSVNKLSSRERVEP